jgi:hypothetical protein
MASIRIADPMLPALAAEFGGEPAQAAPVIMAFTIAYGVMLLGAAFAEGALMFGALAFVPTWLHDRTGMTLSAAGGAVAALGIGGLLYSTNARRVIPRLGERRLLALGGALIAIGYTVVAQLARPPAGLLLATLGIAMSRRQAS